MNDTETQTAEEIAEETAKRAAEEQKRKASKARVALQTDVLYTLIGNVKTQFKGARVTEIASEYEWQGSATIVLADGTKLDIRVRAASDDDL